MKLFFFLNTDLEYKDASSFIRIHVYKWSYNQVWIKK